MSKRLIVAASLAVLAFGSAGAASAEEGSRLVLRDRGLVVKVGDNDGDHGWRHRREHHQHRHCVWRHGERRCWFN